MCGTVAHSKSSEGERSRRTCAAITWWDYGSRNHQRFRPNPRLTRICLGGGQQLQVALSDCLSWSHNANKPFLTIDFISNATKLFG